jgi:hypothetical protein
VGSDPIHPQYHINAIGGQHGQTPRELVVLDDHFHIFAQQGAPDISEWWTSDDRTRMGDCREGKFVHESRGNIRLGCTGVEEDLSSGTTN